MKIKRNAWCIIGALVGAIVLAACSSSGGGSDPSGTNYEITDHSAPPLTVANLSGTWYWPQDLTMESRDSNNTVTARGSGNRTEVINPDGTYLCSEQYHMVSVTNPLDTWEEYSYEKGTISCNGNTVTRTATGTIPLSMTPIGDPDEAMWYNPETTESRTSVICNNKLYTKAFQRVGAGSGLTGTWRFMLVTQSNGGSESCFIHQIVITDTTYTEYLATVANPQPSDFTLHASATYTLIDDNIMHIISDKFGVYDAEVILSGDMLVSLNMTTCYTKQ